MSDLSIQPLSDYTEHANLIASWFYSQWNIDPRETLDFLLASKDCPASLIASHGSSLIGVLAYKRHRADFQIKPELWINALFVLPEFRRRGIGRRLVRYGTRKSYVAPSEQVFVYTDVPRLYTSCGWRHLMTNDETGMHTLVAQLAETDGNFG